MRTITKLFADHPNTLDETYAQHLRKAFSFGGKMIVSGIACLIHGLLPFLYANTGSKTVSELHITMVTQRNSNNLKESEINNKVARTSG